MNNPGLRNPACTAPPGGGPKSPGPPGSVRHSGPTESGPATRPAAAGPRESADRGPGPPIRPVEDGGQRLPVLHNLVGPVPIRPVAVPRRQPVLVQHGVPDHPRFPFRGREPHGPQVGIVARAGNHLQLRKSPAGIRGQRRPGQLAERFPARRWSASKTGCQRSTRDRSARGFRSSARCRGTTARVRSSRRAASCQPSRLKHGSTTTLVAAVGGPPAGQIRVTVHTWGTCVTSHVGRRGRLPSCKIKDWYSIKPLSCAE